jgi:hypothetical protein
MNHEDEYVNEIVNKNEKNSNYFLSKKYKNSLDYEKLKSEEYKNYKLKEKITNYLIPLNLSAKIIDEIFLLTKKFKERIKENILIPIVSFYVIKGTDLNISTNELIKKLKFKKSYYLKYSKYLKDKNADINEIEISKRKKIKMKEENATIIIIDDINLINKDKNNLNDDKCDNQLKNFVNLEIDLNKNIYIEKSKEIYKGKFLLKSLMLKSFKYRYAKLFLLK